ncbi:MAG TPA: hypothetical protein VFO85_18530 [Vicinamibacteria bacterium]|nr:hypothetical protein [Vicinamibacteria bacterium]
MRPARTFGPLLLGAATIAGCARPAPPPSPEVVARAAAARSYSSQLKVSLSGPQGRGRLRVLLAFRRPDGLRIEVPGPTGARLVAVARGPELVAVFPAERAAFEGRTTAEDMDALLGVALTPPEVMDLLLGADTPRLRERRVRWGPVVPHDVRGTLPDGGRLRVVVEDAELDVTLPEAAFALPPREGHRLVDADEARDLLAGRRRRP